MVEQYLVSGDSFRSVYTFFYQFFRVSFVKKSAFQQVQLLGDIMLFRYNNNYSSCQTVGNVTDAMSRVARREGQVIEGVRFFMV